MSGYHVTVGLRDIYEDFLLHIRCIPNIMLNAFFSFYQHGFVAASCTGAIFNFSLMRRCLLIIWLCCVLLSWIWENYLYSHAFILFLPSLAFFKLCQSSGSSCGEMLIAAAGDAFFFGDEHGIVDQRAITLGSMQILTNFAIIAGFAGIPLQLHPSAILNMLTRCSCTQRILTQQVKLRLALR
jgi:hypothetical protein